MTGSRALILIVDDEPDVRDVLKTFLELEHYEVEETGLPEEALQMVIERSPDLVICDVMLTGTSGIELAGAIHEIDARIAIIGMSASTRFTEEARAWPHFAVAFGKPLPPLRELGDAVKQLLGTGPTSPPPEL